MQRRWVLVTGVFLVVLAACSSPDQTRVVVGAGTTLVDSQFMAEIVAAYSETEPGVNLSVVGLSSAEAIALAGSGNADVIITHDRDALDDFLVQSQVSLRFDAFISTFFIVADPAIDLEASSLGDALTTVADRSYRFVSRDDGSGTHAAELEAWMSAGIDPLNESWYTRTGTGMGATLQVTDQVHGVTLAEHGAFLASEGALSLIRIDNTETPNPYDIIVVDPDNNPEAAAFVSWLVSARGAAAIEKANIERFGQQVYVAP